MDMARHHTGPCRTSGNLNLPPRGMGACFCEQTLDVTSGTLTRATPEEETPEGKEGGGGVHLARDDWQRPRGPWGLEAVQLWCLWKLSQRNFRRMETRGKEDAAKCCDMNAQKVNLPGMNTRKLVGRVGLWGKIEVSGLDMWRLGYRISRMDVGFLIPLCSHHWNFTPKALPADTPASLHPLHSLRAPGGCLRGHHSLCLKGYFQMSLSLSTFGNC